MRIRGENITRSNRAVRKDIDWRYHDVCGLMSEEDICVLSTLYSILSLNDYTAEDVFLLQDLDDMNIRGTQIQIGFIDYCHEDREKFKECIRTHDEDMIAKINEIGLLHDYAHKAVVYGATLGKREYL